MRDVENFAKRDLVGLAGHPAPLADSLVARSLDAWRAEEAEHARALDRFLDAHSAGRGITPPSLQAPPASAALGPSAAWTRRSPASPASPAAPPTPAWPPPNGGRPRHRRTPPRRVSVRGFLGSGEQAEEAEMTDTIEGPASHGAPPADAPPDVQLAHEATALLAEGRLAEGQKLAGASELAWAYTYLLRIVGIVAVLLPPVLVFGNMVPEGIEVEGSISAYYYTRLGGVFVGALCAIAVFLVSYQYRVTKREFVSDNRVSTLAGVCGVGVALVPTTGNAATASGWEKTIGTAHLAFAGLFLVLLCYLCLARFTRTDPNAGMTTEKKRRNVAFLICGGVMACALVGVPLANALDWNDSWPALLVFETIAVEAFGAAWLIKGFRPPLWGDRR
jgi:hypothetical protein